MNVKDSSMISIPIFLKYKLFFLYYVKHLLFRPCDHGTCFDRRAGYYCDCVSKYGGKNCSVELIGCQGSHTCLNNGTCRPYLVDETEHHYNCTCPYGFHGKICDKVSINTKLTIQLHNLILIIMF